MTAPSGELDPTRRSTDDTSTSTSTGSRTSSTSEDSRCPQQRPSPWNSAAPEFDSPSAEAGNLAPALPEQRQVPGSHLRPSPHVARTHPVRGRPLQEASQSDACHGGLALRGLDRHPPDGLPCSHPRSHPLRYRLRLNRLRECLDDPEEST